MTEPDQSEPFDLDKLDKLSRDLFKFAFEPDASEDRRTTLRLGCAEVNLARAEIIRLRLAISEHDDRTSTKRKIAAALIVGAISLLAMLASIANSGINYRQMRALESMSEKCSR